MDYNLLLKNISILYLEDDDIVRKNITTTLKYMSPHIYTSSNAIDGMELYKKINPDIIITDIDMPQISGLEFIKEIRQTNKDIPVIILTAYKTEKFLLEAVTLYLEEYIIKPVEFTKLLDAIKKCIDKLNKTTAFKIKFSNGYIYNTTDFTITTNENNIIKLTSKEIDLFNFLLIHKNTVVTYEMIENNVWQNDSMSKDGLKTLVSQIRKKLNNKNIIETLSKVGYKLNI